MGFFSWNCKGCGKSIRGCPCEHQKWMGKVVVLDTDESRVIGEYDGYGRVGSTDVQDFADDPEMWHHKCWVEAGKPEYTGPSDSAQDQGYFVDDCPKCAALRAKYPHRFTEDGQELRCCRSLRDDVARECPRFSEVMDSLDERWYCEEDSCPYHGDGDTCSHAGESLRPLLDY